MIEADIRASLEPELQPGEELLWAEKVSPKRIKEAIDFEIDDGRIAQKIDVFIFVLALIAILIFPVFRILGLVIAAYMCFVIFMRHRSTRHSIKSLENLSIGGYGLSSFNFFILDGAMNVTKKLDARKLKKVRELTNGIALSPIGTGLFCTKEIKYLNNTYATVNFLKSQIQKSKV